MSYTYMYFALVKYRKDGRHEAMQRSAVIGERHGTRLGDANLGSNSHDASTRCKGPFLTPHCPHLSLQLTHGNSTQIWQNRHLDTTCFASNAASEPVSGDGGSVSINPVSIYKDSIHTNSHCMHNLASEHLAVQCFRSLV